MRKHLFVWAVYTHSLGSWTSGLKKKICLSLKDSKKGRLLSITCAPISVPRLLLLLDMMSYLKITLRLMGFIKIISRNSMQIKQSSKLKQMFATVLLKKFTTD